MLVNVSDFTMNMNVNENVNINMNVNVSDFGGNINDFTIYEIRI